MAMLIKLISSSIFFCLGFSLAEGQELVRGQKLPEVTSDQTINMAKKLFRLSDYRGKPVIFDFWSFNCSSCLKRFGETELLQKKFEGRLQILLVNHESLQHTKLMFEKFKKLKTKIKMPELPMITGDTVLHRLFPVNGLPMVVWIDKTGKFMYRTGDMNEQQLSDFVNDRTPELVETDPRKDFVNRQTVFEQSNKEYLKDIVYYSYIAHYLNGTDIGNSNGLPRNEGKTARLSRNAASITELVMMAFGENDAKYIFRQGVNVVLHVSDSVAFMRPDKQSLSPTVFSKWLNQYFYRYDCAVPIEKKGQLYEFMQQDICRYFNLKVSVEKRQMKCLVLKKQTDEICFKANGFLKSKSYPNQQSSEKIDSIYFANVPMKNLVKTLQADFYTTGLKQPMVDETNYDGNIDMVFPFVNDGETNIGYWQKQLARYGLVLAEEESIADVLVISER
jgi:thiol-disulfide isomerase/thioredoxin